MNDTTRTAANVATPTTTRPADTLAAPQARRVREVAFVPPAGFDQLEPLGEGGMGVVYAAREVAFDREVAIKTVQPRYEADSRAADDFRREAQITARLQHPGIPPVHHVGTLPDGRPFLVMKLIRGRTLDRLLDEQGPGADRWLGVFEAVCHAVGYAHRRGVIHRDLKPANIMVGAFGEVQVMDWGLAKVLNSTEFDSPEDRHPDPLLDSVVRSSGVGPTATGTAKGTPAYMPPEQARGDVRDVTERADVFSLGAVLLALLTGKPPYTGGTAGEVLRKAAAADLSDALRRLGGCGAGPQVVALCKRCLCEHPSLRPADAEAVAAEVSRIRRAAERAAHTRRVRRWQVALGVAAAVTLGLTGVVLWQLSQMDLAKARGEQERTKAELGEVQQRAWEAEAQQLLAAVEANLAQGEFDDAFEGYLKAAEVAGRVRDPEPGLKERLERVRKNCRTALDLFDIRREHSHGQPADWGRFERAFGRVGIRLDPNDPEGSAEQIRQHPLAEVLRDVLGEQSRRETDPVRKRQLAAIAADPRLAVLHSPHLLPGFERAAKAGVLSGRTGAPVMFGD